MGSGPIPSSCCLHGVVVKPVARRCHTTGRGTVEVIIAARVLPDVDHPPGHHSIAKDTNPPVVERMPPAQTIAFLEDDEFVLERDVPIHCLEKNQFALTRQSGGSHVVASGNSLGTALSRRSATPERSRAMALPGPALQTGKGQKIDDSLRRHFRSGRRCQAELDELELPGMMGVGA